MQREAATCGSARNKLGICLRGNNVRLTRKRSLSVQWDFCWLFVLLSCKCMLLHSLSRETETETDRLWLLFLYVFGSPWACPMQIGLRPELCSTWSPSSGPRTFLSPSSAPFSRAFLLPGFQPPPFWTPFPYSTYLTLWPHVLKNMQDFNSFEFISKPIAVFFFSKLFFFFLTVSINIHAPVFVLCLCFFWPAVQVKLVHVAHTIFFF